MKTKKIQFKNKNAIMLSANLDLPDIGNIKAYALFAHCFTCSKNSKAAKRISQKLSQLGIAVFRFDFTGLGNSEGDFHNSHFNANIEDIESAYVFLEKNYQSPQILIGHSLGGAAILHSAHRFKDVRLTVSIASPATPQHVSKLFVDRVETLDSKGEAEINIGGRHFYITKDFYDKLEENSNFEAIKKYNQALLIFHSPVDNIVGIDQAAEIYKQAKHPKNFISLDNADHLISNIEDALFISEMIYSYAKRHITFQKNSLETTNQTVVSTSADSFTSQILSESHYLIADEPKSFGGNNLGPSPYGLLLSALGACTTMTLQMYAQRKKWDLEDVKVHLNHDKIHSKDCQECEQSTSKIDRFERKIELIGNLDNIQKERLLEIAEKCPVHKTLLSKSSIIETTLI